MERLMNPERVWQATLGELLLTTTYVITTSNLPVNHCLRI